MATFVEKKTKDGIRYKVLIRLKGYPTEIATFERLTDAKQWAKQTEAAIVEGRYFKNSIAKRKTFGEAIDRYLEDVIPFRHGDRISKNKVTHHLTWWKEHLGSYFLTDITPAVINELRDKLLRLPAVDRYGKPRLDDDGKPTKLKSPATVVRYLASLSVLFTVAINEWEWAEKNPVLKVKRPKEPKHRERTLDDYETQILLVVCKKIEAETQIPLHTIVTLALGTGARRAEVLWLTWDQVNLEDGYFRLHETKNDERRSVVLGDYALHTLREHHKRRKSSSNLLFPRTDGKKPVHIEHWWEEALLRAGITNFNFHDLRHCLGTTMADVDASVQQTALQLGHSSVATTMRYVNLKPSKSVTRAVRRADQAIFGALTLDQDLLSAFHELPLQIRQLRAGLTDGSAEHAAKAEDLVSKCQKAIKDSKKKLGPIEKYELSFALEALKARHLNLALSAALRALDACLLSDEEYGFAALRQLPQAAE